MPTTTKISEIVVDLTWEEIEQVLVEYLSTIAGGQMIVPDNARFDKYEQGATFRWSEHKGR